MNVRIVDLFCGGGGSSWGARASGAQIVCGADAWEVAARTYADNFPGALVVNRRLHRRSNRNVLGKIGPIDLILASPECTNHTCARGSRERDEESRNTALFVLNFVRSLRPRWVVIENVVQMRLWSGYASLVSELKRSYRIRTQILDAANFGVPQHRRRLFILCDREGDPPDLSGRAFRLPPTVEDFLDLTGSWPANPLFNGKRAEATLQRARRAIETLGEGVPFLIVYYGSDGAGGWQSLNRPLRTITTLDRFGLVEWTSNEPTLRMLQVPELKRAMGFDNAFEMRHGLRRDKIMILGNAVSPPVITAILQRMCVDAQKPSEKLLQLKQRVQPTLNHLDRVPA
jgi:DNA (cytosine-5)-methyltransferase 1